MLKKKKAILFYCAILFFVVLMFIHLNTFAAIDYASNESYYQKLCNKRSSYNANKSVCVGYENYLKNKKSASKKAQSDLKTQIEETKGDIADLTGLIQKQTKLIEDKKADIAETESEIKQTEEDIKNLEDDILQRLALMQQMDSENFVIDFLMSSQSIDDFLTKVDGVNAINDANKEVINDLDYAKKQLKTKKTELVKSKKDLESAQAEQKTMLKEYYSKESELFQKLQAEQKNNAVYNKMLNNINVNDITGQASSKGFILPVKHAVVTAAAWYYPIDFGGGWHPGVDLANNWGTPIYASANGVILATGSGYGYGNYMVAAYQVGGSTYTMLYGHLQKYANYGSTIKQGQVIAYMGSTGNSTGPHVHVEVIKHTNQSLKTVINQFKSTGDFYFGLGYTGIGSCSSVCRLKPHVFFGLSYGQSF
ncbi:MAG: peptidoglycan DD-metalloendopeptidase family protein [Bacilli bacterium]|jgi:murein DD-endopeptidase MepM/ murein hydrolase activator NlpD|nr:peptidoglycan DD-metalloendopeptidase family protein [Bacilli bacterium]